MNNQTRIMEAQYWYEVVGLHSTCKDFKIGQIIGVDEKYNDAVIRGFDKEKNDLYVKAHLKYIGRNDPNMTAKEVYDWLDRKIRSQKVKRYS